MTFKGPALIGKEQLQNLADGIEIGGSHQFFVSEESQIGIVHKVSPHQLERVRGEKNLYTSVFYLSEFNTLALTIEETPDEEDGIVIRLTNHSDLKKWISSSSGIEIYFVTDGLQDFSIRRLFNSPLSSNVLKRELQKM